MRWNALGIFRPGAWVAEVRVTPDRARAKPSRHDALEYAGIVPNAPEMGTIRAHVPVHSRARGVACTDRS